MKTNMIVTVALMLIAPCMCALGGTVSSSPAWEGSDREIIVSKDNQVTINVVATTGNVVGTSVTFSGSNVLPTQPGGNVFILEFDDNQEGKENSGNINVIHKDGDETCESGKDFSFKVIIPKIEVVELTFTSDWPDPVNRTL